MEKAKIAEEMANLLVSELRKQIAAIRVLHPMEQKKIREIIRYQAIKCMEETEAFK